MNEVLETIKKRRSVRRYSATEISRENLDWIIEAGRYAPSANNSQPWHFTVVQNPELLRQADEIVRREMARAPEDYIRKMVSGPSFRVTYGAPVLIVVSGKEDAVAQRVDCAAAMENMLLAARSLGIGSVWLGLMRLFYAQKDEVAKLGIPPGYAPLYAAAFGYPADDREPAAPKRKPDAVDYIL